MEDLESASSPTSAPEPGPGSARSTDEHAAGDSAVAGQGGEASVPAKPPRTRVSAAFQGFVLGAIVLALLLIFILENTESVKIN